MKKITFFLCLLLTVNAMATDRTYLCGVTKVSVEKRSYGFMMKLTQKAKNTAEYTGSNSEKVYETTVDLALNTSNETPEGVYLLSADGFNTGLTAVYYNNNTRRLNADKESKFTIAHVSGNQYEIREGELNVQNMQGSDHYCYKYSYDVNELNTQGIGQTAFAFTYGEGTGGGNTSNETFANYDMTVNGVSVRREDNDYGMIRYFMTLDCTGKRWGTNNTYNYEVQLDIMPTSATISGTFASAGNTQVLAWTDTYVKWLKEDGSSKTRYIAKDSLNSITIQSKGGNQYRFTGGTLICQDITIGVMGDKQIDQTLYYHFNDAFDFGFDEDNKTVEITPTSVDVQEIVDGYQLTVVGTSNGVAYNAFIELESESLVGAHTVDGSLSLWSKVGTGSKDSYVTSGSTVNITQKSEDVYTLSATMLCENEYTYVLLPIDFNYGSATGVQTMQTKETNCRKFVRNGVVMFEKNGIVYDLLGAIQK